MVPSGTVLMWITINTYSRAINAFLRWLHEDGHSPHAMPRGRLSPKQERVIRLRFGIGCEREHTLDEIGQEFGVTRERIEAKALRELRSLEWARHLRPLLAAC